VGGWKKGGGDQARGFREEDPGASEGGNLGGSRTIQAVIQKGLTNLSWVISKKVLSKEKVEKEKGAFL